jgi:bifunctional non-homologous end joining protein LigD
MLIERMRKRLAADRPSFIEPCLPSPADKPPSGANLIHEIKHDGYRLMARPEPVGIRLITRRGNDWTAATRVVEAVNRLKVRSCLNDGEVMCCEERGLARFDVRRAVQQDLRVARVSCQLDANQSSLRAVARRDINKTAGSGSVACG